MEAADRGDGLSGAHEGVHAKERDLGLDCSSWCDVFALASDDVAREESCDPVLPGVGLN